jgi:uncharacterized protein
MSGSTGPWKADEALAHEICKRWSVPKGGDVEPFFDLFHKDATFDTMAKRDLFPEVGGRMNWQQFHDYVYNESRWTDLRVQVVGTTAQVNRLAVEADGKMDVKGKIYNNVYHWVFELRDGKISAARFYLDTLYAKQFVEWLKEEGANMPPHEGRQA